MTENYREINDMMKLFLLLVKNSFRNLLRNKRRTILTGFAIIISTIAMLLIMDYNNTSMFFFRESQIKGRWGHIQIKKKGYFNAEASSLNFMLTESEVQKINAVLEDPNIKPYISNVVKRLNFSALLLKAGDSESTFVSGSAIAPQEELMANPSLKYSSIVQGEFLTGDTPGEVIIGKGIADRLNIKINDSLYLYSIGNSGLPDIIEASVKGITCSGIKSLDDLMISADINDIKKLFGTENIHDYVIFLDKTENTDKVAKYLQGKLSSDTYEIFPWQKLATDYIQIADYIFKNFSITMLIIVIVLIFLSTNTMLMSVMERMNEFGTLRAIGRSRNEISFMIIIEAIILGIISSVIGVLCSFGLAKLITSMKIMLAPPPGQTVSYPITIFINFKSVLLIMLIQFVTTLIATVYPVIKMFRVKIIDAIRYK